MGRKPNGFFRIIPKAGRLYLIKVRTYREGDKVRQKFVCHVGAVEDIRKVVCGVQNGK